MTRFTFIRHGETQWNVVRRIMGHLDSALTPTGIEQVRRLAARLADVSFDAIHSSDLGRALATADILRESREHCRVVADARLRERRMGVFESLTIPEARAKYPGEWKRYEGRNDDYALPGGESPRAVVERTREILCELERVHEGRHVLIVTHGGVLTALFQCVFDVSYADAQRAHRPNAALNVFVCEDSRWLMETWGDVAHLEGLRALDDPINQPQGGS